MICPSSGRYVMAKNLGLVLPGISHQNPTPKTSLLTIHPVHHLATRLRWLSELLTALGMGGKFLSLAQASCTLRNLCSHSTGFTAPGTKSASRTSHSLHFPGPLDLCTWLSNQKVLHSHWHV